MSAARKIGRGEPFAVSADGKDDAARWRSVGHRPNGSGVVVTPAITFVVPGEPQGKGRAKFGMGRTYTPAKTVSYEGLIAHEARLAMRGRPLMTGALEMLVEAFLTVPASDSGRMRAAKLAGDIRPTKKPDWDNAGKVVSDACNKVVYGDDAQIVRAVVEKFYGDQPRVAVTVRPHSKSNNVGE